MLGLGAFFKSPIQMAAVSWIFLKQLKIKPIRLSFVFFFLQPINSVNYISEVVFVLLGVC